MDDLRIAAVQFEHRDADKAFNLSRIDALTAAAVGRGARIVCFHECCVSAYSFVQPLSKADLLELAEPVPDGPSVEALIAIARKHDAVVMAGLFESDEGDVFNTYVTVEPDGYITKFRKLHAFVNEHVLSGDAFNVIDLSGWKVGFLTCYDNNLIENVRITTMMGAQVIIAPHVTGCLPSPMPGRGTVDRALWDNRERDPVPLRQEFEGPKGRGWLNRWLPARAYDNGVYYVFTNPIGVDYETIKPGLATIYDCYGETLTTSTALGDDVVVATLTPDKLEQASGYRYRRARRPELYGKLVEPQESVTSPGWTVQPPKDV